VVTRAERRPASSGQPRSEVFRTERIFGSSPPRSAVPHSTRPGFAKWQSIPTRSGWKPGLSASRFALSHCGETRGGRCARAYRADLSSLRQLSARDRPRDPDRAAGSRGIARDSPGLDNLFIGAHPERRSGSGSSTYPPGASMSPDSHPRQRGPITITLLLHPSWHERLALPKTTPFTLRAAACFVRRRCSSLVGVSGVGWPALPGQLLMPSSFGRSTGYGLPWSLVWDSRLSRVAQQDETSDRRAWGKRFSSCWTGLGAQAAIAIVSSAAGRCRGTPCRSSVHAPFLGPRAAVALGLPTTVIASIPRGSTPWCDRAPRLPCLRSSSASS
jgi:hypothetical protein